MGQALASVVVFVLLLALLPSLVRWLQRRVQGGSLAAASTSSRLVSALAVGPQQKVVTVEVGPEGARTWLVLGVTAQNITCLQSIPVGSAPAKALPVAAQDVAVQGAAAPTAGMQAAPAEKSFMAALGKADA